MSINSNSEEIRELMDRWAESVRTKNIEAAMAPYGENVVAFDLIEPLEYNGVVQIRERLEKWLSSFEGSVGFEFQDLHIEATDAIAFCYALNHVSAINKDGTPLDMWWRSTICWLRDEGEWKITHEHSSVPFDMNTGQASTDLTPDYIVEQGGR